jgi:hypothetical protein
MSDLKSTHGGENEEELVVVELVEVNKEIEEGLLAYRERNDLLPFCLSDFITDWGMRLSKYVSRPLSKAWQCPWMVPSSVGVDLVTRDPETYKHLIEYHRSVRFFDHTYDLVQRGPVPGAGKDGVAAVVTTKAGMDGRSRKENSRPRKENSKSSTKSSNHGEVVPTSAFEMYGVVDPCVMRFGATFDLPGKSALESRLSLNTNDTQSNSRLEDRISTEASGVEGNGVVENHSSVETTRQVLGSGSAFILPDKPSFIPSEERVNKKARQKLERTRIRDVEDGGRNEAGDAKFPRSERRVKPKFGLSKRLL